MSLASRVIDHVMDYRNPASIGSRFRARRIGPLVGMIEQAYRERGQVEVLDVGGTREYWNIIPDGLLKECRVRITVLNRTRSASALEDDRFTFAEGDGCDLAAYGARHFDIAHSNSVLEHVGDWSRMTAFASEIRRVATRYFVQTPHFWFPLEPHAMCPFFHWLPKPLRVSLVTKVNLGPWGRQQSVDRAVRIVEDARLLDSRMFRALFPDGRIITERVALLPKSLIAVRETDPGPALAP